MGPEGILVQQRKMWKYNKTVKKLQKIPGRYIQDFKELLPTELSSDGFHMPVTIGKGR